MGLRLPLTRPLALALICGTCFLTFLDAEPETGRARIALFEPAGQKADAALTAALSAVADSVELSLLVLERYDVRRLSAADPAGDLARIRAYCDENRIDQAIVGSGSARAGGGYSFRLAVYDRREDAITVDRHGGSTGVLDMFDVTDALVADLLDGLSGTHLLFGSLAVATDPAGATVAVNGKDVGESPVTVRGLPVGALVVSARADGRENAEKSATIVDGETTDLALALSRSVGSLAVEMPDDAVAIISGEIGAKRLEGAGVFRDLPTGQYEIEATCAGLSSINARITINRNETQGWMPWPNGYLSVESDPPGSAVFIDGTERGASPVVLEVEPGKSHTVTLKRADYQDWGEASVVPAARKQSLHAALTLLPGSIQVSTNPPGALVRIDDARYLDAPHLFEAVPPGTHTVMVIDLLKDRRYYTSDGTFTVDLKPGEKSVLSVPMTPGKAKVKLTGFPNGSEVSFDGQKLDSGEDFASGIPVPAGTIDVVITAPSGQKWKSTLTIAPGKVASLSQQYITVCYLPTRTIKVDGKPDDWADLLPVLSPETKLDIFPNQPGTQITEVYACRDDKTLFLRMDFGDGTPSTTLSKDITTQLRYSFGVHIKDNNVIVVDIAFSQKGGTWAGLSIWNATTREVKTPVLPFLRTIEYKTGQGTLEIGVPIEPYMDYVNDGSHELEVNVASSDSNGTWLKSVSGGSRMISFVP